MGDINLVDAIDDAAMDEAFETPSPEVDAPTPPDVSGQEGEPPADPAADQPATPSEKVVDAPETSDKDDADKAPSDADIPQKETEDKETPPAKSETPTAELNWQSAPEQFREEYTKLKKEVLAGSSLKDSYFESPEKFLEELNGLSSRQFQQTTQEIVKKGIDAMPDDFAEYIASVSPESVAKAAAKADPELLAKSLGLDMPLDKARKIIAQVKRQDLEEYLNDNDGEAEAEQPKEKEAKPQKADAKLLTPEEVDKLVEQKLAEHGKPKEIEKLKQTTYSEIMKPVEAALAEAGLTPKDGDSAEDKKFKEWASKRIFKDTFDYLFSDEKTSAQTNKAVEFIEALDEGGVKHLIPILALKAEDYALEQVAMLTNQRAKVKTKPTEKKKDPPKVVPSGGVAGFGSNRGAATPIKDLSEDDFASVGI